MSASPRCRRSFAVRSRTTREDFSKSFRREHLRCIHGRRQQTDEIANRRGSGLVAFDRTGQGILGPRALGFGMAPEREQAHEARRHGEREDGQERRDRRPAPAPATGVFELRDWTRPDREPIEPALQVVRQRAGRGISPPWVFPQASQGDRFEVARQTGNKRPGRGGLDGFAPGRASRSPTRPETEDVRSRGCTAWPRGQTHRIADRSRRGRRQSAPVP